MKNHQTWTRPVFVILFVSGVMGSSWSQDITNPNKEGGTAGQTKTAGSIAILTPSEGQVVQQRQSLMIRWMGDLSDNVVQIQFIQGTTLVQDFGKIGNSGKYE